MADETAGPTGDFERYGLVAALTLGVLCLLAADRIRSAPGPAPAPPPAPPLRLRPGGAPRPTDPRALRAPQAPPAGAVVANDPGERRAAPAGPTKSAGVAARPEVNRTCVVAAGETLGDIALRELGS